MSLPRESGKKWLLRRGRTGCNGGFFEQVERRIFLAASVPAPHDVTAAPDAHAGIDVNWKYDDPNTNFIVERAPAGSNSFAYLADAFYPPYTDTSVAAYHAYRYRVQAQTYDSTSTGIDSPFSTPAQATAPLNPPLDLSAAGIGPHQIELTWGQNGDPPFHVDISRSTDGVHFKPIAVSPVGTFDYLDSTLAENTEYTYRVRVVSGRSFTDWTLASASTELLAPTHLTVTAAYTNQINLAWQDSSTVADSIAICRSDDGGMTYNQVGYAAPGATTFSDTYVQPGMSYSYYVAASFTPPPPIDSPIGVFPIPYYSDPSNTVTVTSPAFSGINNLTATAVSASSVDLSWANSAPAGSTIELFRSLDGIKFTRMSGDLPAGTTSFAATGLRASTSYYFAARAVTGGIADDFITAQADTFCPAPTNLKATFLDPQDVELTWTNNSGPDSVFSITGINGDLGITAYTNSYKYLFTQPGQTVQFQVFAQSGQFSSAGSNIVTVTPKGPFPGDPDPSFTADLAPSPPVDNALAVALQSDGKVVVTGDGVSVFRLDADGVVDPTFGVQFGTVYAPYLDYFWTLAVQNDGKIVAAGVDSTTHEVVVDRIDPDGHQFDATFGTAGTVEIPFAGSSIATSIAVQSDGGIVVAAGAGGVDGAHTQLGIARLTPAGVLDPTFGQQGIVALSAATFSGNTSLVIQSDQRILAAGGGMLARLMPDGALDPSFGNGGSVAIAMKNIPFNIALQSNGMIVAPAPTLDFTQQVFRLNSNGSLDTSFDDGGFGGGSGFIFIEPSGGIFVTGGTFYFGTVAPAQFSAAGQEIAGFAYDVPPTALPLPYAAIMRPDGRFILAGANGGSPYRSAQFACIQLLPDGHIDGNFVVYGDGVSPDDTPLEDGFEAVLSLPDGKIAAAGNGQVGLFNANGALNGAFGTLGSFWLDPQPPFSYLCFDTLALDSRGDILAGGGISGSNGSDTGGFVVVRLLPDGTLDPSFGNDGVAITPLGAANTPTCKSLIVQPDGKILAVGSTGTQIAAARYLPSGALDKSFGSAGQEKLASSFSSSAVGAALQSDGKIVIGGNNFDLTRLLSNGARDSTFGKNGFARFSFVDPQVQAFCMAVDSSGDVLLGGGDDDVSALVRFTAAGAVDRSFGKSGLLAIQQWSYLLFDPPANPYTDNFSGPITDLAIEKDGSYIVTMSSGYFLIMARLQGTQQDLTFGDDGADPIGFINDVSGSSMTLDAKGQIILSVGGSNLVRVNK